MLFQRDQAAPLLQRLADEHQVYLGTSSWKFPDWCGLLYDEERYLHNHRFAKARFERDCLAEYAEVFHTVCVDATYYRYPNRSYLEGLMRQVPQGFRLSFKVPDDITIKTYPQVATFGSKAGKANPDFLDDTMFRFGFLRMLEPMRDRVGLIVLEFSHFHTDDFEHGRDFVDALDRFFTGLEPGWQIGVEVRNKNLLHPDYFAMLENHGVVPIYNHWTQMPPLAEQLRVRPPESLPFIAARFLLTPGRPHAWARENMTPFSRIYEVDPEARGALRELLHFLTTSRRSDQPDQPSYLYIGNELEGCALHTIADALEEWDRTKSAPEKS